MAFVMKLIQQTFRLRSDDKSFFINSRSGRKILMFNIISDQDPIGRRFWHEINSVKLFTDDSDVERSDDNSFFYYARSAFRRKILIFNLICEFSDPDRKAFLTPNMHRNQRIHFGGSTNSTRDTVVAQLLGRAKSAERSRGELSTLESVRDLCSVCGFTVGLSEQKVSIKGILYHRGCFKCARYVKNFLIAFIRVNWTS